MERTDFVHCQLKGQISFTANSKGRLYSNQTIRYFFSMANDFNPYSDPRASPFSDPRANDFNQASSFFSMANDFNSRD